MTGAAYRLILSQGQDYQIRNASGGGGRDTPTYGDDGTVRAVLERRGIPTTVKGSDGEDIETDVEIRAVLDGETIREAGSADGYPTKLVHPSGRTYQVVATHAEDSGVTVLTVVRD